jgi:hypothetical protein
MWPRPGGRNAANAGGPSEPIVLPLAGVMVSQTRSLEPSSSGVIPPVFLIVVGQALTRIIRVKDGTDLLSASRRAP